MTPKKALVRPFAVLVVVALAVVLTGCPTTPRRGGPPNVDRAVELTRTGDHAGAAAIYERLAAETTGSDSAEFRLRAARAWLAAGRAADADRVLALLPGGLTQQQALEQSLLRIQSALVSGRGDEAWRQVSSMQTPTTQPAAARYYETRQQVAIATGHLLDGIRSELARERLIGPGDARLARSELLAQLRTAAENGASLAPPPGSDATVRGWLEAASVAVDNNRNPTLGATRLAAFRARFPSHPALAALSGEPGVGIEEPVASLEPAPHLALMLPLSGRTSAPAAQIRDGFMTAYYQVPAATRPRLRIATKPGRRSASSQTCGNLPVCFNARGCHGRNMISDRRASVCGLPAATRDGEALPSPSWSGGWSGFVRVRPRSALGAAP
jgi:outer membrane PBP1 activator LpoA protein